MHIISFNPKTTGEVPLPFSRVFLWFFVTFNTIVSHILPENFIEIPQVVQKL